MKQIILLAAFLSSVLVYGQNKNEWRVGTHFQLNRGFDFGSNNSSYNGIVQGGCYEPYYSGYERMEFTVGINANYRVTKNFELGSGIHLTKRNYSNWFIWNYNPYADVIAYPFNEREYSLETPIIARYYVLPNKFKMHFELGQIVGIPLRMSNSSFINRLKLDAHAGLGVDYFIGRFQIAASVNYRRNWSSLLRTEMYQYKVDRLGVELRTAIRLCAD